MLNEFTRAPHSRKPPVIYIFQSDGDYASRRGVPSLIRHAPSNSRFCIISRCFYCTWGLIKVAKQKPQPTIMTGYLLLARYISIQLTRDLLFFWYPTFIWYPTELVHLIRHKYLRNSIFYQVPCLYHTWLCYSLTNEIVNASFHSSRVLHRKVSMKKKSTFDILLCRDTLLSTVRVMTSLVWRVDQYSRVASWVQLRTLHFYSWSMDGINAFDVSR